VGGEKNGDDDDGYKDGKRTAHHERAR